MSEVTRVTELEVGTDQGTGRIRDEGDKLVIIIPKPTNKSVEDIQRIPPGHSCHNNCYGLITNIANFL